MKLKGYLIFFTGVMLFNLFGRHLLMFLSGREGYPSTIPWFTLAEFKEFYNQI